MLEVGSHNLSRRGGPFCCEKKGRGAREPNGRLTTAAESGDQRCFPTASTADKDGSKGSQFHLRVGRIFQ
jgi:hypothetical protein